jgi:hypothetical protein
MVPTTTTTATMVPTTTTTATMVPTTTTTATMVPTTTTTATMVPTTTTTAIASLNLAKLKNLNFFQILVGQVNKLNKLFGKFFLCWLFVVTVRVHVSFPPHSLNSSVHSLKGFLLHFPQLDIRRPSVREPHLFTLPFFFLPVGDKPYLISAQIV